MSVIPCAQDDKGVRGHCWVNLLLVGTKCWRQLHGRIFKSWLLQFFDEGVDPSIWSVGTKLFPVWLWG